TASARKDLRHFYDSCGNDGKKMYHLTTELLQEKGLFQRDPYFYPEAHPEYISGPKFLDAFLGDKRQLAATEIIALSFIMKKKILEKTLSIGFSQVAQSKEVRKFLMSVQNTSDDQIQLLGKLLKK